MLPISESMASILVGQSGLVAYEFADRITSGTNVASVGSAPNVHKRYRFFQKLNR